MNNKTRSASAGTGRTSHKQENISMKPKAVRSAFPKTPKELTKASYGMKKLLADMSYFNAAESSWFKERNARESCKKKLVLFVSKLLTTRVTINHIKKLASEWLVSESDYIGGNSDEPSRIRKHDKRGDERQS